MNIVQLHERVRFWIDTVASTRFESEDIDQAIINSTNEVVDEKYDHSRLNHRGDSFQRTQRVRDELSDITKELDTDGSLTLAQHTGYALISTFPEDYRFLTGIAVFVGSLRYNCWPLTYDRKNVIDSNPFRRVRSGLFPKCYYIESEGNIKVYHPYLETAPTKVEISYLANPIEVFYGYEKGPSDTIGYPIDCIASLSPTRYDSVDYKAGDTFTTNASFSNIDYGLAVVDWINPNINGFLHEEISKRAAANCLLTAGNFEKYKALKAEVLAH
jgi:hypothetical protein